MKFLLLKVLVSVLTLSTSLTLFAADFYVIGMGSSSKGDLLTIRGKNIIEKDVSVIIVPSKESISKENWGQSVNFAGKEVLICPHNFRFKYGLIPNANAPESFKKVYQGRLKLAQDIETAIQAGKKVAWLEEGDPMIYGNVFLLEMVKNHNPQIAAEIVPSIGALPSASAALQKNPTYGGDTSAAIITMHDWEGRLDINEELMRNKTNMIVYTMRLDFPAFIQQLKKHYNPQTPLAVVFDAGEKGSEEVIVSSLEEFMEKIYTKKQSELESRNNLLFIGKFVTGSQARPDGLGSGLKKCCN